uniref:Uncharacterized protein n=1 Tax=Glossina morsitans morsitans TaxID=37546 RepID=A0A1B0FEY6_GLOMM
MRTDAMIAYHIGAADFYDHFPRRYARSYAAKTTQEKIRKPGLKILPHSTYSPNLTPSAYHLCRPLEHTLRGGKGKTHLEKFFNEKSKDFFCKGKRTTVLMLIKGFKYTSVYGTSYGDLKRMLSSTVPDGTKKFTVTLRANVLTPRRLKETKIKYNEI